jgi:hypothetical protein
MILSLTACTGLVIYCFTHGLILTGFISLLGLIPGPGTIPLLIVAVILAIHGHYAAALVAPLIIGNNIRIAFKRVDPDTEA